eukprot:1193426-Prorocentrum_minimum.AAC.3
MGSPFVCVSFRSDWSTQFLWRRPSKSITDARSEAIVRWEVPVEAAPGRYRLRHFGSAKRFFGRAREFSGTSRNFDVTASKVAGDALE